MLMVCIEGVGYPKLVSASYNMHLSTYKLLMIIIIIALCELHGNSNLERCKKCGKEYLRDFRTRNAKKTKMHLTGKE